MRTEPGRISWEELTDVEKHTVLKVLIAGAMERNEAYREFDRAVGRGECANPGSFGAHWVVWEKAEEANGSRKVVLGEWAKRELERVGGL